MTDASEITFTRLTDGTLLRRQVDGTYRPVVSETDHARLAALREDEIERMAASDPDHPALDDAFWDGATMPEPGADTASIRLDDDVLGYFREAGPGDQARINGVLRRYVQSRLKAG